MRFKNLMNTNRKENLFPAVSVVIPCHNDGAFLEQSVQSVLAQRNEYIREIIVVDDSSTDPETLDVQRRLSALDDRIECVNNTRERGPSGARNSGAERASGEWLAFLDADDIWESDSLMIRLSALEEYPEAGWITADYYYWAGGNRDNLESHFRSKPKYRALVSKAIESGRPLLLRRPVDEAITLYIAWTSVTLVKKSLFSEVGGFDETLVRGEDNDLWQRLALQADLVFVPQPLALYRQRPGSVTAADEPPGIWNVRLLQRLRRNSRFSSRRALIDQEIVRFSDANVYYHRKRGEFRQAFLWSCESARYAPLRLRTWKNLIASIVCR